MFAACHGSILTTTFQKVRNEISDSKRLYKWTAHVQFGVRKYPIILLPYSHN